MKNTRTALSINEIVRVSEVLELYKVAFKQDPDNTEFYRGAFSMLTDLGIDPRTASALLTTIQFKVRIAKIDSEKERQEEYDLTVKYQL
jgi:DNA-binding SARP family transcriptional activator